MAPSDPFARPTFGKLAAAFGLGVGLGLVVVLPVIQDELSMLDLGDPGPVGAVLLIGILSVAVVSTGLFALYRLFWLVDR